MTENTLEYRTLPGLWREYDATERSHAFKAEIKSEAQEWQQRLQSELITLLGGFPLQANDLSPQFLELVKKMDLLANWSPSKPCRENLCPVWC